jgi:Gas vesicle synthesis protein GvpL/GvpF
MTSPDRPDQLTSATYVYGVTVAGGTVPDAPGIGDGGRSLRLLPWETLAAIVSDVQRHEVGAATRSLRAHARVLDAAIEHGPVVPLRFGTMVDDEAGVVSDVLQPHRDRLHELLERLGEHVELSVKARYDEDLIVRELVTADPLIAALHERIAGVDPEAAYYERIQIGERVAAALEERRARDAEEIYELLGDVADDACAGEPLDPHMAVNGTFLVRRTAVDAFNDAIGSVAREHPELEVRYVGPLPPYSFSDIELVG